jgi:hypothetical protein
MGAPVYTLVHQIGHALGCVHNREAEAGNNDMIFPYAFGKRWFSEWQGVRSVMAYDDNNWLYFSSGTGKWMYYENADKIWSEINSQNYPVGWLWFNHYPWVYSSTKKGWFYFKASTGQLIYYSNQEKVWRVLEYRK